MSALMCNFCFMHRNNILHVCSDAISPVMFLVKVSVIFHHDIVRVKILSNVSIVYILLISKINLRNLLTFI